MFTYVCNIILFLDFFPIFLFRNQLLIYPDAFKLQVCIYVHWYIKLAYLVLNRSLISDVIICYSMYFLIVTPLLIMWLKSQDWQKQIFKWYKGWSFEVSNIQIVHLIFFFFFNLILIFWNRPLFVTVYK